MIAEVFITCAVTGAGSGVGHSLHVPMTPEQIPTPRARRRGRRRRRTFTCGIPKPGRARGIRRSIGNRAARLELGCESGLPNRGNGGDLVLRRVDSPLPADLAGTDMVGAIERLVHVKELCVEICTLNCGTPCFATRNEHLMVTSAVTGRCDGRARTRAGGRPELELFDTGQLVLVNELLKERLIDDQPLMQLCMWIPCSAPDDPITLISLVHRRPAHAVYSAFSIGRMHHPRSPTGASSEACRALPLGQWRSAHLYRIGGHELTHDLDYSLDHDPDIWIDYSVSDYP